MNKLLLTLLILGTSLCQLKTHSMQFPKVVTSSSNLIGIISSGGGGNSRAASKYIMNPQIFFKNFDQRFPRLMGDFMRSLPYTFYYLISVSVSYLSVDPRKMTGKYGLNYLTDKGLLKISLIYEDLQGNDGFLHFTGSSLIDGENRIGANLRQNYIWNDYICLIWLNFRWMERWLGNLFLGNFKFEKFITWVL